MYRIDHYLTMITFVKGVKKLILIPVVLGLMLPILLISLVQLLGGAEETIQDKFFKKLGLK